MRALIGLAAFIGLVASLASAAAHPKQIIILRHGEKTETPDLCPTGKLRAQALASHYLGRGAADSLFGGATPAVFYAITVHTIATITPAATTWGMTVKVPPAGAGGADKESVEDQQTQLAANDVMTNPDYHSKIVVMTWGHKQIANRELQEAKKDVTLLKLLHLKDSDGDKVPHTWSNTNYDYFWIVDFGDAASDKPTGFRTLKQDFVAPYQGKVPNNDWKTDEPANEVVGCAVKTRD